VPVTRILRLHVSADECYQLHVDGEPARGHDERSLHAVVLALLAGVPWNG
jgi:hypothetical protein